jgi:hypothetical protein
MATVDNGTGDFMALLGVDESRMSLTLGRRTGSRIRMLHGSTSSTAAPPPRRTSERRQTERVTPEQTRWAESARLRPGFDVRVMDIGPRGVLIEAPTRLHIGTRVELALFENETEIRLDLVAIVRRCHVSSLGPLTYRAGLEFSQAIEVAALQPFLATAALSA